MLQHLASQIWLVAVTTADEKSMKLTMTKSIDGNNNQLLLLQTTLQKHERKSGLVELRLKLMKEWNRKKNWKTSLVLQFDLKFQECQDG